MSAETTPTEPEDSQPFGLLLSRDLIFTTRVTETARALGHLILTAGSAELVASMIARWRPRVVFVDLAAGDLVQPAALIVFKQLAGPETAFVAFGAHVDTRALADARAAGCDPVLPRSRFATELPELIRRYCGRP
jgi:hypothetical protein